jgi:hypothetical protein
MLAVNNDNKTNGNRYKKKVHSKIKKPLPVALYSISYKCASKQAMKI